MAFSRGLCRGTEGLITPWLCWEPRSPSLPPHLPVVEAAGEREHAAGKVTQPDVVALQDNITQGTAPQGW